VGGVLAKAFDFLHGVSVRTSSLRAPTSRTEGQSENLPALVKVSLGKEIREFHVDGASQQLVLPLRGAMKQENEGVLVKLVS
jgi:hypothetical protein